MIYDIWYITMIYMGEGAGGAPFAWKITWCPWAAPGILAKARRLQLADASFRDNHQFYQKMPEIETKPSPNWCFILTVTTLFGILTTLHCPVLTDISPGAGKLKPSDTCSAAQIPPGRSRTLFHSRWNHQRWSKYTVTNYLSIHPSIHPSIYTQLL